MKKVTDISLKGFASMAQNDSLHPVALAALLRICKDKTSAYLLGQVLCPSGWHFCAAQIPVINCKVQRANK